MTIFLICLSLFWLLAFLFQGRGYLGWTGAGVILFIAAAWNGLAHPVLFWVLAAVFVLVALIFGVPAIRRMLITANLFPIMKNAVPRLGETERIALEAGTVWWDAELFSGKPDWKKLIAFQSRPLTEEEQAFVDGPVEELCAMIDDWDIGQRRGLPDAAWDHIREHKFFGLMIPEEYGGHGFSTIAHSEIVTKIATRSVTAAVTVMVPNSLGPGELLMHYGTTEQKEKYLPRLADATEIPCFALTGPEAGSDAAATQSTGTVCKGQWQGKEVLGMRMQWKKRYITLAPLATLIGLAFRLKDPDGLLGDEEDLGITCALIPADTEGVNIGDLHDPMGVPFANGPIEGTDVFVPLEFIIGGLEQAGNGWRMLMESLAAGRTVSLPALSVGAAMLASRVVGAYGSIREQFDTPIGRFEGIEEPLARIGSHTYFMDAARVLTCGAVDAGERPSVLAAVLKAYLTEAMRDVIADAMDIRAGAAIQRGPRNVLARAWTAVPIAITVEGANILTRSMIIYGQGAIRSHPYIQKEMEAVAADDISAFDKAFFGHVNLVFSNAVRAWLMGLTDAHLTVAPVADETAGHYRMLSRYAAAFSLVSDTTMATLGGMLKRKEKISGRLADALAWMYLAASSLKRWQDEGRRQADLPFVHYTCRLAQVKITEALVGVLENLPVRPVAALVKWLVFPLGVHSRPPSDRQGAAVARALLEDRETREHLTHSMFVPPADEPGLGTLEAALDKAVAARHVETKLRDAVRADQLDRAPGPELGRNALKAGIITREELEILEDADACRREVIRVDRFTPEAYQQLKP